MARLPQGFEALPVTLANRKSISAIAEEILADLREPVILCGLSMGGIVAMEIVAQRADLVAGMILLDTNALDEGPVVSQNRNRLVAISESEGPGLMSLKHLMRVLVHQTREQDKSYIDRVYDMAEEVGHECFISHAEALASRRDYSSVLQRFGRPVKIIYGDSDMLTPEPRQRHLVSLLAMNSVTVIPECGHLSSLESPVEVSEVVNLWLTSHFKEYLDVEEE